MTETPIAVEDVRKAMDDGVPVPTLAAQYGVSNGTMLRIVGRISRSTHRVRFLVTPEEDERNDIVHHAAKEGFSYEDIGAFLGTPPGWIPHPVAKRDEHGKTTLQDHPLKDLADFVAATAPRRHRLERLSRERVRQIIQDMGEKSARDIVVVRRRKLAADAIPWIAKGLPRRAIAEQLGVLVEEIVDLYSVAARGDADDIPGLADAIRAGEIGRLAMEQAKAEQRRLVMERTAIAIWRHDRDTSHLADTVKAPYLTVHHLLVRKRAANPELAVRLADTLGVDRGWFEKGTPWPSHIPAGETWDGLMTTSKDLVTTLLDEVRTWVEPIVVKVAAEAWDATYGPALAGVLRDLTTDAKRPVVARIARDAAGFVVTDPPPRNGRHAFTEAVAVAAKHHDPFTLWRTGRGRVTLTAEGTTVAWQNGDVTTVRDVVGIPAINWKRMREGAVSPFAYADRIRAFIRDGRQTVIPEKPRKPGIKGIRVGLTADLWKKTLGGALTTTVTARVAHGQAKTRFTTDPAGNPVPDRRDEATGAFPEATTVVAALITAGLLPAGIRGIITATHETITVSCRQAKAAKVPKTKPAGKRRGNAA